MHGNWIPSADGLSHRNPAPDAAAPSVPNAKTVEVTFDGHYVFPSSQVAAWQYRWTNPGDYTHQSDDGLAWHELKPAHHLQTIEDKVREMRGYISSNGKPCYEVRALGVILGL